MTFGIPNKSRYFAYGICVVSGLKFPKILKKRVGTSCIPVSTHHLEKVHHLDLLLKHFIILLYSAYLKYEDPLSGLIYAWQERGKSTVTLSVKTLGLLIDEDITSYGLLKQIENLYKKRQLTVYHHLLIPDLEKVTARTRTVKNELRALLQGLMFDGIQHHHTYYIDLDLPYRYKLGVIACVTPDVFNKKSSYRRLGFLSRLIPFSFNYCHTVVDEILDFIGTAQEDKLRLEKIKLLRHKKVEVTISDHYLSLLVEKAKILAQVVDDFCSYDPEGEKQMFKRIIGTRAKRLLTCYLKALALVNEHTEVQESDWTEFEVLFSYFNFRMEKLP
jgi:hypothetical protein